MAEAEASHSQASLRDAAAAEAAEGIARDRRAVGRAAATVSTKISQTEVCEKPSCNSRKRPAGHAEQAEELASQTRPEEEAVSAAVPLRLYRSPRSRDGQEAQKCPSQGADSRWYRRQAAAADEAGEPSRS